MIEASHDSVGRSHAGVEQLLAGAEEELGKKRAVPRLHAPGSGSGYGAVAGVSPIPGHIELI